MFSRYCARRVSSSWTSPFPGDKTYSIQDETCANHLAVSPDGGSRAGLDGATELPVAAPLALEKIPS